MEIRYCCECKRKLTLDLECNDFVVLKPCNCNCCPKCAFSLCSNRKFDTPECPAPNCRSAITGCVFYESNRTKYRSGHVVKVEEFAPSMKKDPCRFFYNYIAEDDTKERRDKMLLTLSYSDKSEDGKSDVIGSLNVVLDKKHGPETKKDRLNLRLIFALMHDPIMIPHLELAEKELHPRMSANQFATYCVEQDQSYLLQLLYALTTGKTQCHPIKLVKPQFRNDKASFLATCVAKQLIERANTKRPGPLQLMMGDALQMMNAPSYVVDFLSKFRITEARSTTGKRLNIRSLKQSMEGIQLHPLDAFCLHFDNFGFKGWRGRWSQHTVIQVSVIKKEMLEKLGFYSKEQNTINRRRKQIEDLIEECNGDEIKVAKWIVAPRKEDYEILTNRVLTTITSAIEYALPTPNESRIYIDSPHTLWPTKYPSNFGVNLPCGSEPQRENINDYGDNIKTLFHNKDLVEHDPNYNETYYETNSMELDNVLHGDPNGNLIVKCLLNHLEKSSGKNTIVYDECESGGEEPVRFIISPATADGAPAKRSLDLIAEDISKNGYEDRSYKLAKIFLSGFHFQMEVLTMRGRLFRDLFSFFGRKWRRSDPAFNWILTIRDPREALKEYREYLLAHYRAAAEAADTKNAVEVHQYMLDRAVEVPTCMATLLDLRILQIIFMIQDSEKAGTRGDVPLFLTTMRFAMSLFCITHAVNYSHLVSDFLEWHELASEAERILFENFYYTKLSPNGKPIWVDRGVEWTVRHIRSFLGHKMRGQGHDKHVGRVVSEIPFRVKAKRDLRYILGTESQENYTTEPWNEQTFSLGLAFHTTRVALADTNFWGPGRLEGELECSRQDTGIFVDANNSGSVESPISSSILGGFDLGTQRAIAYYKEHHIDNRYSKKRSEKVVNLKLLPTIHAQRNQDIELTRKVRLSWDVDELVPLQRNFPVESIIKELDFYKEFLFPDVVYKKNQPRRLLCEILCKYRKQYFIEYPDVFASMQEGLRCIDSSDSQSTRESRGEQIKSRIYQLDDESLRRY